ncbi:hypothetical protein F5X99DRAFT_368489 [Biscogniauxia marginata]|nr:hypothetical protein F5X99DRAFT_368489 [Biscogniauxia marginata]
MNPSFFFSPGRVWFIFFFFFPFAFWVSTTGMNIFLLLSSNFPFFWFPHPKLIIILCGITPSSQSRLPPFLPSELEKKQTCKRLP